MSSLSRSVDNLDMFRDVFECTVFFYAHAVCLRVSKDATQSNGRHFVEANTKAYTQSPRIEKRLRVCVCVCLCARWFVWCLCARRAYGWVCEHLYVETCFEHVNSCRTTFHLIYISPCMLGVSCMCRVRLALLRCMRAPKSILVCRPTTLETVHCWIVFFLFLFFTMESLP